jgi:mannosyltransferase
MLDNLVVTQQPQQSRPTQQKPTPVRVRRPIRGLSVILGLLAFAVSFAASWVPSFWGDEAASVMSAERSWTSLFRVLGNVDAVHGSYYAFLHLWIGAFGASPLSVRLPSALAVGFATAGIVVLVRRLGTTRLAIIAAVIFMVLPRTTYMGEEARSYALSTACAVWLVVFFTHLVGKNVRSKLAWLGFSAAFAASVFVFLYVALLAPVFAIAILLLRRDRSLFFRWLAATGLSVVLASPVIVYALLERNQISFLAGRKAAMSPRSFFVTQWFDGAWILALVGWVAIAALCAWVAVEFLRRHRLVALNRRLFAIAVLWLVIPPSLLWLANTFVAPLYTVRYGSFVTPAVAILFALALDQAARVLRRRWLVVPAALAIVALAAPLYVAQRGPQSKDPDAQGRGSDWAQVAQIIGQNSRQGDSIVFDDTVRPSHRPRLAEHLYPADFTKVTDVEITTPYQDTAGLWDETQSLPASADRLAAGNGRVWLVDYMDSGQNGNNKRLAELKAMGYQPAATFTPGRDSVYLLTKGS